MLICQKSHLQSFSMSSPVNVLKNMWSPRPCWHICCDNIHLCAFRLELNITLSDSKRRLHKHAKSASRTCKSTVVRSRRSQIALQCRSVLGQEKNKKKKPGVRALQLFIQNFKTLFYFSDIIVVLSALYYIEWRQENLFMNSCCRGQVPARFRAGPLSPLNTPESSSRHFPTFQNKNRKDLNVREHSHFVYLLPTDWIFQFFLKCHFSHEVPFLCSL